MKNSPHHNKHLKHQAIKEANTMENTPQKGLENPEFKKQFNAKDDTLPHKADTHHKKCSKRCSHKDMPLGTESSHIHDTTEHRLENAQKRTNDANIRLDRKMSKHRS